MTGFQGPQGDATDAAYLQQGAARLGLNLGGETAAQFLRYREALLAWNERINLTAVTEPRAVLEKHFLDSLGCWLTGRLAAGAEAVDVGTGAGLPGLALRLYGGAGGPRWTLVEATAKKLRFVAHASEVLGIGDVRLVHGRAEELARQPGFGGRFDVAVARAVARLPLLVGYCLPLLKEGGCLLAMKGPAVEEELAEAAGALGRCGGAVADMVRYRLPFSGDERAIVVVERRRIL